MTTGKDAQSNGPLLVWTFLWSLSSCGGQVSANALDASPDASDEPADGWSDAGGESEGTDALDPTHPRAIFGLRLMMWLDADEPSTIEFEDAGARVSRWRDRTQYNNDVMGDYTDDYAKIEVSPTAANGRSALVFSGGKVPLECTTGGSCNATETGSLRNVRDTSRADFRKFVITVVAGYTNDRPREVLLIKDGWLFGSCYANITGNPRPRLFPDANTFVYGGIRCHDQPGEGVYSAKPGWNDGKLHAFTLRVDRLSAKVWLRIDGMEAVAMVTNMGTLGGFPFWIGGETVFSAQNPPFVSRAIQGYIAEVLVVDDTSGSPQEMKMLGQYIQKKYGIPL